MVFYGRRWFAAGSGISNGLGAVGDVNAGSPGFVVSPVPVVISLLFGAYAHEPGAAVRRHEARVPAPRR